ncbi:helix-turn-helix transcriptional regulator [uncultured Litoreibacter sp.]|uniref:helix-turn-helix transcriptional regulator n=1 Tax=uncultured Litoreibacter sp. TaxID=1392394 RepID=UPI0026391B92|nr:helix-turn-helix transcriptional regulator [uncultured Litoreibacter sp.]
MSDVATITFTPKLSHLVVTILVVQVICGSFFTYDILASVFGLRASSINWQLRELIEIGAIAGLLLGSVLGFMALRRTETRMHKAEGQVRLASGAFMEVVNEHYERWGLTPAERDVATFAMKGMSIQEIAALRETSAGTIKAQTNAIYRKANVSGRPQLMSLFVEELIADEHR